MKNTFAIIVVAVFLTACANTTDVAHVKKDWSSVCRSKDPYCEKQYPILGESGIVLRVLPGPQQP